ENKLKIKEAFGQGPIQNFLSELARKLKIWVIGGTIPIIIKGSNRARSACLVFNDEGQCIARYDKIHLFDVEVNTRRYKESDQLEPGDQIVTVDTPAGRLGLAVCYDLRFPELFRHFANRNVDFVAVPSAFTPETGKAHFETLCKCRAIENQMYLIAACQTGGYTDKKSYGHSMIINPWGEILAKLGSEVSFITAEIDRDYQQEIRRNMPVFSHQKIFTTKD
nr:carbon-nitrogen hydrolase family protein [Gammaproteobacteria bacterium]